MYCPICGAVLNGCCCPCCGFDLSQCREQFPTLMNDGKRPESVGAALRRRSAAAQTPIKNPMPAPMPDPMPGIDPQPQRTPMPQQPSFPPSNRPVTAAAPAKRSGKKLAILGIGAVLLVGIAVLLYLIMGGNQTELTMDAFVDKYIEAYKAKGDYASFVTEDDQSFRNSTLARVETLSGESSADNLFGASQGLSATIQRKSADSIYLDFCVYPDERTAEAAIQKIQAFLEVFNNDVIYDSNSGGVATRRV